MKKELEATPSTLEEAIKLLEIAKGEILENEKSLSDRDSKLKAAEEERDKAQEASRKNFNAYVNVCNAVRGFNVNPVESESRKPLKTSDIKITPKI